MSKAGGVVINFTVNAANYSAGIQKIKALNKEVAESAKAAGHTTVSQMQATSASLRLLEGGLTNNLRAAERFAASLPGVGAALKVAFPIVGVAALGSMIAEATMRVTEFIQKQQELPNAIKFGFGSMILDARAANDELELVNDKLSNEIAKLQGKPQNNLAIELDEARIKADDLARSLDSDYEKLQKLLKDNRVGVLGGLLGAFAGGNASTAGVSNNINNFQSQIDGRGRDLENATNSGDKAGVESAKKELARLRTNYRAYLASTLKDFQSGVYADAGKPDANINILQGAQSDEAEAERRERDKDANAAINVQKQQVLSAKELGAAQAEAARKAAEAQMKGFEDAFASMKINFAKTVGGDLPVSEEIAFWQRMQAATKAGSNNYITIQKTIAAEVEKQEQQKLEKRKLDHAAYLRQQQEDADNSDDLSRGYAELLKAEAAAQDKAAEESLKLSEAFEKAKQVQKDNIQLMAESTLQMMVATGAISAQDAAVQQASIHAAEYGAKIQALRSVQANMVANPLSDPNKQQARLAENQNAQDELSGQFAAQQVLDQAAIANEGFVGQWKISLNTMTNDFTDFAKGLSTAFQATLGGVNDEIVKVLTSKRLNSRSVDRAFADAGKAGATSLVGAGLKGVEGLGLKALGFGSKPMHVIVDNLPGAPGKYDPGNDASLDKYLAGGASGGGEAGGFISGALRTIIPFLPGLATGGPVGADVPIVVGEKGPEVFMPRSAGQIIPNGAATGGDTHHHHYHIDARGAQNPATTAQHVGRILQAAGPKIVAASIKAQMDMRSRKPRLSST